jgi:hypothetical protein
MSFFEEYYAEKSEHEISKERPSEKYLAGTRKDRVKKWIKKCLEGAIESNEKNIGEVEERIVKLRVRLANGDDSVIREIMVNRFQLQEASKQKPFLEEELKIMFGQE